MPKKRRLFLFQPWRVLGTRILIEPSGEDAPPKDVCPAKCTANRMFGCGHRALLRGSVRTRMSTRSKNDGCLFLASANGPNKRAIRTEWTFSDNDSAQAFETGKLNKSRSRSSLLAHPRLMDKHDERIEKRTRFLMRLRRRSRTSDGMR